MRRTFFHYLNRPIAMVILLVMAINIVSCGGGGGSSSTSISNTTGGSSTGGGMPGTSLPVASGTVVVPDGYSIPVDSLHVMSVQGTVPVSSNGTFSVPVTSTDPILVMVLSPGGKVVMFGFVNGGDTGADLSPTSTSTALLFYALGAFTLPEAESQQQALSLIRQDPNLPALIAAVTASMLANPMAMSDGDPTYQDQLKAAQAAILQTKASKEATRGSIVSLLEKSPLFAPENRDAKAAPVTVTPSFAQSGTTVAADADGNVTATNSFRRFCSELLLYKTVDNDGKPLARYEQVGPILTLTSVFSVTSVFSTIVQVFEHFLSPYTGTSPFSVPTQKIDHSLIPPVGTLPSTKYVLVQLSPVLNTFLADPDFFSDSHFDGNFFRQEYVKLECNEFLFDALLPLLGTFTGIPTGKLISKMNGKELAAVEAAWGDLSGSMIAGVSGSTVQFLIARGTIQDWISALGLILQSFGNGSGLTFLSLCFSSAVDGNVAGAMSAKFASTFSLIFAANVLLEAVDLARIGCDISKCEKGEKWDIDVTQGPPGTMVWPITLTYTETINRGGWEGTQTWSSTINVHLTAIYSDGIFTDMAVLPDSTATITSASGELSYDHSTAGPPPNVDKGSDTMSLGSAVNVPFRDFPVPYQDGWTCTPMVNSAAIKLFFSGVALKGLVHSVTYTTGPPPGTESHPDPDPSFEPAVFSTFNESTNLADDITLPMDSTFTIQAGGVSAGNSSRHRTLTWGAVGPTRALKR